MKILHSHLGTFYTQSASFFLYHEGGPDERSSGEASAEVSDDQEGAPRKSSDEALAETSQAFLEQAGESLIVLEEKKQREKEAKEKEKREGNLARIAFENIKTDLRKKVEAAMLETGNAEEAITTNTKNVLTLSNRLGKMVENKESSIQQLQTDIQNLQTETERTVAGYNQQIEASQQEMQSAMKSIEQQALDGEALPDMQGMGKESIDSLRKIEKPTFGTANTMMIGLEKYLGKTLGEIQLEMGGVISPHQIDIPSFVDVVGGRSPRGSVTRPQVMIETVPQEELLQNVIDSAQKETKRLNELVQTEKGLENQKEVAQSLLEKTKEDGEQVVKEVCDGHQKHLEEWKRSLGQKVDKVSGEIDRFFRELDRFTGTNMSPLVSYLETPKGKLGTMAYDKFSEENGSENSLETFIESSNEKAKVWMETLESFGAAMKGYQDALKAFKKGVENPSQEEGGDEGAELTETQPDQQGAPVETAVVEDTKGTGKEKAGLVELVEKTEETVDLQKYTGGEGVKVKPTLKKVVVTEKTTQVEDAGAGGGSLMDRLKKNQSEKEERPTLDKIYWDEERRPIVSDFGNVEERPIGATSHVESVDVSQIKEGVAAQADSLGIGKTKEGKFVYTNGTTKSLTTGSALLVYTPLPEDDLLYSLLQAAEEEQSV